MDWNDLLRLRRVCKASNILVNYHIRSGAALNISPWITIYDSSETNKPTLSSFLELGFPLAKIYLMNTSGKATFTNSVTKKFVHRFGKNIHHLRVYKFSNVPSAKEQKFYQGLVNLQSLTIDKIEGVSKSFNMLGEGKSIMQTYTFEDLLPVNKNLPGIFKQLKQLIIHASPNTLYINLALVSREITQFCEKLENAGDAFGSFVKFGIGGRTDKKLVCQIMNNIERQVLNRQSCLKSYDFQGFYEAGLSPKSQEKINSFVHAPFFLQLAKTCGKKSVNLKNINVWWLAPLDDSRRSHEREIILAPLVSMVHMHGAAYTLDLVNLEKLVIPATSQSCLYPVKQMKVGIWPKLAVLEITVDSFLLDGLVLAYDANTQSAGCMPQAPTSDLMRFLLVDIARPVLKELTLRYVKGVECDVITVNLVARLGKCCPNLQKLVLVNWPGNNSILQEGLTGLNKLEELSLERCKLVGNDAFKNVGLKGKQYIISTHGYKKLRIDATN